MSAAGQAPDPALKGLAELKQEYRGDGNGYRQTCLAGSRKTCGNHGDSPLVEMDPTDDRLLRA